MGKFGYAALVKRHQEAGDKLNELSSKIYHLNLKYNRLQLRYKRNQAIVKAYQSEVARIMGWLEPIAQPPMLPALGECVCDLTRAQIIEICAEKIYAHHVEKVLPRILGLWDQFELDRAELDP